MQTLKDFFYSISATNMVDIAIMACLIYFVLAWFRGTKAFQILATLLGIGFFYFAASWLGLILTSVLFQYLWAAIIVVVVIVFQPEIREMLDRASPIRYLNQSQPNDVNPNVIEETVLAVADLARTKLGALIVFQRLDKLDNLVLTGKLIDALFSSEALTMIFQRTSPLHDGAVLVRKDRIKAVSCILPLSKDEDLGSHYGTRHRAALGLTERSDALCVVVSEERGEVSLVEAGKMTIYKTKSDFRQALERGLVLGKTDVQSNGASLASLLRSNWRLKIFSFATATLLWFVIVGPQSSELGISVPIQYTNLPAGMEITGKWMDRVDVRVRGTESGLANLKPGSIRAVLDLSNVITGLNYFRITNKSIQVPPGVTIAQIRPSDLNLHIETALAKKISVLPTLVGDPPEQARISITPSEVRVRALQDDLKKVTSVTTDPVNVAELIGKGKITVSVVVKPEGLKIESIDPLQVTVALKPEQP